MQEKRSGRYFLNKVCNTPAERHGMTDYRIDRNIGPHRTATDLN